MSVNQYLYCPVSLSSASCVSPSFSRALAPGLNGERAYSAKAARGGGARREERRERERGTLRQRERPGPERGVGSGDREVK